MAGTKLKDLPPLALPVVYSNLGTYIFDANEHMICDIRGWGWIQKLSNPEAKQDALGKFIAEAINEKIEKETYYGRN